MIGTILHVYIYMRINLRCELKCDSKNMNIISKQHYKEIEANHSILSAQGAVNGDDSHRFLSSSITTSSPSEIQARFYFTSLRFFDSMLCLCFL